MSHVWRRAARQFFDDRANAQMGKTSLESLSYISGRDFRVWEDKKMYDDLISSIIEQSGSSKKTTLLEVGCASGFLAFGLAPKVCKYVGIDVSSKAVRNGKNLNLSNAEFRKADGLNLPFPDNSFEAVICYDVFTNFPKFEDGEKIIEEMVRVLKPNGRALVGSIPDFTKKTTFEEKVLEVSKNLDKKYGPASKVNQNNLSLFSRIINLVSRVEPNISCYYFNKRDFSKLAEKLEVSLKIFDIHSLNPYRGLRFNAVYMKKKN